MALDYRTVKNWPFEPYVRQYTCEELMRFAMGFGAGLPGPLQAEDMRYIGEGCTEALPMVAVALADGEFWQRDPRAGLNWKQIVHAEEAITMHRPLPLEGTVIVERRVVEIFDRGVGKGALVHEQQLLRDECGVAIVSVDVLTVLRGDGGFGGSGEGAPRPRPVPGDCPPDETIELVTPTAEAPLFALSSEFDVTASVLGAAPTQRILRGMCAFGLAGRAVLKLACGNQGMRLRRLSVRYAGAMLTDETMRVELWHTGEGQAAFRMHAIERDTPILHHCHLAFEV
ncbi:MaoC/PaaZ C-terminal domain-containing protein [Paraburkholderia phymatum]|uniref:MaoC/PaaZ C-terminal domain-containing protein n=1 Tax=Paraburkholderia phymatum TaxID=148447 RepID=UPI00317D07AC